MRFCDRVCLLMLSVMAIPCWSFEEETIQFFHGLEPHNVKVIPHTRPPYVSLPDVLSSLSLANPSVVDGNLAMTINGRPLIFDQTQQRAIYKQQSIAFPMRERNGELFVRVNKLAQVMTDMLGRRMIYEETSKTMHMPKSELVDVSIRGNAVPDGYRLVLSYSQPIRSPRTDRAGRDLSIKIADGPLAWDRVGFSTNDAIKNLEIFEGLPDGSTEVLVRVGNEATRWQFLPYNPRNPRTVLKIWGNFGDETAAANAENETTENKSGGLRRIVIDPGHGGRDQGAVGPTGLKEKDVTLAIARMLRDRLMRDGNRFEVRLTRDSDTLLSLKDRTGIANNFKADLFISIHVNAIRFQNARGSETYYLSLDEDVDFDSSHYDDFREQTLNEGTQAPAEIDDDLTLMLWDMAQAKHLEDSFRVSRYIQSELNNLARIKSRGVKQAPLKVLKGATMPAVLIEAAFISNRLEENRLKSPDFLEKIVESIHRAIRSYDLDLKNRAKGKELSSESEDGP